MTHLEFALRLATAFTLGSALGLKQIISRLSLEPAVTGASWRVVEQSFG